VHSIACSSRSGNRYDAAIRSNIELTSSFSRELQNIVDGAQQAPQRPIILEAYGPNAYEGVYSLTTYLRALGVKNSISVRAHAGGNSAGVLDDRLESALLELERNGGADLVPLEGTWQSEGCISVGIDGTPDARCLGFEVKTSAGS
jgi:hypothetical protein